MSSRKAVSPQQGVRDLRHADLRVGRGNISLQFRGDRMRSSEVGTPAWLAESSADVVFGAFLDGGAEEGGGGAFFDEFA